MTDNDRDLLEMAARAVGRELDWCEDYTEQCASTDGMMPYDRDTGEEWHPLIDDGGAFRLAVKLKINIEHMETLSRQPHGINCWPVGRGDCGAMEHGLTDYAAATRRAIVRAAAAIGESMK